MKKIAKLGVPFFFILPWVGFLVSLCDVKSKSSRFVYLCFAMLFGYAISFSDSSADSYRYAEAFARFDNTIDYKKIIQLYQDGEMRDLYRLLLFYFTSIFSNNPKVMYAFAGLVYGIFSYLNLKIFVQYSRKLDKYVFILALVFFTYISLANINGFRFWTGGLILFYSVYNYIILRKKAWIVGIMITPLFHYGFMLMVPLLILYSFIHPLLYSSNGVKPAIIYIFIGSFFASWVLGTNSIDLSFFTQSNVLSGQIGERLDFVNSAEVTNIVESRKQNSLFLGVQKYFDYAIKIYVFISVLYLNRLLKKIKGDKKIYTNVLAFVLFFYSFTFIAVSFPSGSRFFDIAHLFLFILLLKFHSNCKNIKLNKLILWALPVFSFNIAFVNGMLPILILTPTFWYGNFFWIILEGWGFYL